MKTFWKAWFAGLVIGLLGIIDFVIFMALFLFLWGDSKQAIFYLVRLFCLVLGIAFPPAIFMALLTGSPVSKREEIIRDFWKKFKIINPFSFYGYYFPRMLLISLKGFLQLLFKRPQASN